MDFDDGEWYVRIVRQMKYPHFPVGIHSHFHSGLVPVDASVARFELKFKILLSLDSVVFANFADELEAEDLMELFGRRDVNEGEIVDPRFFAKAPVVIVNEDLLDEPICFVNVGNTAEFKFSDQPVLQGAVGALDAALGLWRVGWDELNAEFRECPIDLRFKRPIDLTACWFWSGASSMLGRMKKPAGAIRVDRHWEPELRKDGLQSNHVWDGAIMLE